MTIKVKILRFNPEQTPAPHWVEYDVTEEPGMSVLAVLHQIHDTQDGTLAYRYSCRGAICGTCAVTINGTARLACKTQVNDLRATSETITIAPLSNYGVIKDLVVDQRVFWQAIATTMPWLVRKQELPDEHYRYETHLNKQQLDQLNRAADCIKCGSCYADCPKVKQTPNFIGPAVAVQIYRQLFDPRDTVAPQRIKISDSETGVNACDKHAVCVKVCPKDCRPLRAITFIQQRIKQ